MERSGEGKAGGGGTPQKPRSRGRTSQFAGEITFPSRYSYDVEGETADCLQGHDLSEFTHSISKIDNKKGLKC
ncbi:hypothetical protein J6590_049851 [Homalodisca vitripennis]|nr:hypothetical protein J6590_049851 [Homalodisca vitripennis]